MLVQKTENVNDTGVNHSLDEFENEVLVIQRTQVKHGFFHYFSNSSILNKFISVQKIDLRGIVEREAISIILDRCLQ